ncbi:unnamed protein product (macronuclear) [Paramecium tetraurelia]|uniref:Transmembrane protein n=1 Tax=Paramecium tetraurelia TaxID=5888 RepID=A0C1V3_PARTE|nr:uncharacterized protein GSPATT00034247001 [Paramecium tetraurelia]CAK64770.1 unnamed protein product [Paramecium tetraurelia]|eukprot:XP_001432167.1 hypothetical protein (macronuclear) [Paramecium tetraurelia strain d4-2]
MKRNSVLYETYLKYWLINKMECSPCQIYFQILLIIVTSKKFIKTINTYPKVYLKLVLGQQFLHQKEQRLFSFGGVKSNDCSDVTVEKEERNSYLSLIRNKYIQLILIEIVGLKCICSIYYYQTKVLSTQSSQIMKIILICNLLAQRKRPFNNGTCHIEVYIVFEIFWCHNSTLEVGRNRLCTINIYLVRLVFSHHRFLIL